MHFHRTVGEPLGLLTWAHRLCGYFYWDARQHERS
jgi:hypothetical protein